MVITTELTACTLAQGGLPPPAFTQHVNGSGPEYFLPMPNWPHGKRATINLEMKPTHRTPNQLAREAKAIVALAFRNGPIEDLHAGKPCPTCFGCEAYSHVTDEEMQRIMQNAVQNVYRLLVLRTEDHREYERQMQFGERYTVGWDDPAPV
jgi:hypothetical protein